jgi:transposase
LRREFYKLHIAGVSQTATWTLERMADLWAVEEQIRGCDPQTRRDVRRRASTPIVIENWRRHYIEVRRHSSLGYRPASAVGLTR